MTTFVSGTFTAGNPVFDLSTELEIIVTQSGSIQGQNTGIGTSGAQTSSYDVVVHGEVYGTTAVSLSVATARSTDLTIGAGGTLLGLTDGVAFSGEGNVRISNQGSITGINHGVSTSFFAGDLDFFNSGTISANMAFGEGAELSLTGVGTNYGVISGFEALDVFRFDDSSSPVVFFNHGSLFGATLAYNGDSNNPDHFTNTGTITGGIDTEGNDDRVINSGTIAGDVLLNNDGDLYDGRGEGLVTGTVLGGSGNDTLRGSDAADNLDGGTESDLINGRGGDDTLMGDTGADTIFGGNGNDSIDGEVNDDLINGNAGDDTVLGSGGDDTLRGGRDDDELRGGSGADNIRGDSGDDLIIGGADRDDMFGGSGNDVFLFENVSDSGTGAVRDRIYDFRSGEDVLDIGQLAGPLFQFLGSANFTGSGAREVRAVNLSNGTLIYIDQDGDGSRDSDIYLIGTASVTEGDFLL